MPTTPTPCYPPATVNQLITPEDPTHETLLPLLIPLSPCLLVPHRPRRPQPGRRPTVPRCHRTDPTRPPRTGAHEEQGRQRRRRPLCLYLDRDRRPLAECRAAPRLPEGDDPGNGRRLARKS